MFVISKWLSVTPYVFVALAYTLLFSVTLNEVVYGLYTIPSSLYSTLFASVVVSVIATSFAPLDPGHGYGLAPIFR
ncbi:hypothetical protein D3C76_534650 [compost metagenome]